MENIIAIVSNIATDVWSKSCAIMTSVVYVLFGHWLSREKSAKVAPFAVAFIFIVLFNAVSGGMMVRVIHSLLGYAIFFGTCYFVYRFAKKVSGGVVSRAKEEMAYTKSQTSETQGTK